MIQLVFIILQEGKSKHQIFEFFKLVIFTAQHIDIFSIVCAILWSLSYLTVELMLRTSDGQSFEHLYDLQLYMVGLTVFTIYFR